MQEIETTAIKTGLTNEAHSKKRERRIQQLPENSREGFQVTLAKFVANSNAAMFIKRREHIEIHMSEPAISFAWVA